MMRLLMYKVRLVESQHVHMRNKTSSFQWHQSAQQQGAISGLGVGLGSILASLGVDAQLPREGGEF